MSSAIIKFLGGVAVAGLIATGGSAFTASGVTESGTAAQAGQIVGGVASQDVYGVGLTGIDYEISGADIVAIRLSFSGTAAEIAALVALEDADAGDLTVAPAGTVTTPFTTTGVVTGADPFTTATAVYTGSVTAMTGLVVTINGVEQDVTP